MKYHLIIAFLFFSFSLFAQQKGVSPLEGGKGGESGHPEASLGQAYAVVVGISDYQDEGIPDLRFADKDAEAFAGFLQSPAGGSLDEDHLKVLVNQEATMAQVATALDWMMDVVQEGDQAIIYFSGHGDVESKTFSQPGYLLCWDSPSRVYMAGGTLPILMFQLIVSTLSLEKKAKVIVITDACRAGKLAGSDVNGSKLTSNNLARQFANEIKILSCQPDEYSIEGEQWGGGRGAFSYHLVDGLYGLADNNQDLTVNLQEISRYLEDKVSTEVAPHQQMPMSMGNNREKIAIVDPNSLEQIKNYKKGELAQFTPTVTKGLEEEVLSLADSVTVVLYKAFQQTLEDKAFFEPEGACADFYYTQLIAKPLLAKLHAGMRRNYAAALQDDAQQFMNQQLQSEAQVCMVSSIEVVMDSRKDIPRTLRKTIELLGKDHYMYPTLQARLHWFEGYLIGLKGQMNDPDYDAEKEKASFLKALSYQSDMPLALLELGVVYGWRFQQLDSAQYYFDKIFEISPDWLYAQFLYVQHLNFDRQDWRAAKRWLDKMLETDSTSALVHSELGNWYKSVGEYEKAEKHYLKSLAIFPTYCEWLNLANVYKSQNKFHKAEESYKKAIELSPGNAILYLSLANVYMKRGEEKDWERAAGLMEQSLALDSINEVFPDYLGMTYFKLGRIEVAKKYILEARKIDPSWPGSYVSLGLCYLELGKEEKARAQFELGYSIEYRYEEDRWLGWWVRFWPGFGDGEAYFDKLMEWFPGKPNVYYEYARYLSSMERYNEAFQYLETSFKKGFKDIHLMDSQEEEGLADYKDFEGLRAQKDRWEALMQKYYPEQNKN